MKALFKQIFVNFSISGLVSLIEIAVTISLSILMPRFLGQTEYGIYVFATAFAGLVFGFVEMGVGVIVTRDIAKTPGDAHEILANAFALRMVSASVGLVLMWGGSLLPASSDLTPWVLRIVGLTLCLNSLVSVFVSTIVGLMQFKIYLLIAAIYRIISFSLVIVVLIVLNGGVVLTAFAFLIAQLIALVVALGVMHKRVTPIGLRFDKARWAYLIKEASPVMLANISANFTNRSDSVLLTFFRNPTETGIYGAAYNILLGVGSVSSAFLYAAFPTLAKTHVTEPNYSEGLFKRLFAGYVVVGLAIALGLTVFAEPVVTLLYGSRYASSAEPLRILGWGVCVIILNRLTTNTLNAVGLQRYTLYSSLLGTVLNVGLNLWLIPILGYIGASITTFIGEGAVLIAAIIPLFAHYRREAKKSEMVSVTAIPEISNES